MLLEPVMVIHENKSWKCKATPYLPYPQEISCCSQQIRFLAVFVWDEHDLCCWIGMIKWKLWICLEITGLIIKLHNFNFVPEILDEGTNSKTHELVFAHTPVHPIDEPRSLIGINLRPPLLIWPINVHALFMGHEDKSPRTKANLLKELLVLLQLLELTFTTTIVHHPLYLYLCNHKTHKKWSQIYI